VPAVADFDFNSAEEVPLAGCLTVIPRTGVGEQPWRLQAWLGHSTINMTMRYVHHVEEHHRPSRTTSWRRETPSRIPTRE
jgi:hypothetical protein